jgi:UDP-2,4-diacetamido-2,4,6-trideoxy-beta-L-altropyranose hydrolase
MALRRAGAECTFICAAAPEGLLEWIGQQGFAAIVLQGARQQPRPDDGSPPWRLDVDSDATATIEALRRANLTPDWLIVDHYGADGRWEELVRPGVGRILAIDDLANRRHEADVLLDQNLQDGSDRYAGLVPPRCRRLLGPRYALLRPSFAAARAARTGSNPRGGAILACVGGSDPHDVLSKITAAWSRMKGPRPALKIAVGRGSPNAARLEQTCAALPGVTLHMPATDMAALMAESELLIGTTGSISWERCCMGLPAIMGTTADNQKPNLAQLCRLRTGLSVGDWAEIDAGRLAVTIERALLHPTLLARMGARAAKLVDGRGAERVAALLLRECLTLRRAEAGDANMAWSWRNAESTRRNSADPTPIPYGSHVSWWTRTLADQQRDLLIAVLGDLPVGVLRLDQASEGATVSIYLDPELTGLGLGRYVLLACQRWSAQYRSASKALFAEIRPQNSASIAIFEAAGFAPTQGRWVWDARACNAGSPRGDVCEAGESSK